MRCYGAHLRLVASPVLALAVTACKDGGSASETVRKTIGIDGGLITSADGVLTIAIRSDALSDPTEISIQQSDDPPRVHGPAYRVEPDIDLAIAASISYRYDLPRDPDEATIGVILREEFEAGQGRWNPLPVISIDPADELVKSTDARLSMYYALLAGDSGETTATTTGSGDATGSGGSTSSPTSDTSGSTSSASTTAADTTDTTTGSTGDGGTGTGVSYPPECDNLFTGPYTVLHATGMPLFPGGGSEDLAMSGFGTFVGASGSDLLEVDENATASSWATNVPTPILGARYTAGGALLIATFMQGSIQIITEGGVAQLFADGFDTPNGIYPDGDENVWVTDFGADEVIRINRDRSLTTIASGASATEANGILYDDLRRMVFWTTYSDSQLWRASIGQGGTPGAPTMVADLQGTSDGIALDVCGNIYVVDHNNGGSSRLDRVFLDETGTLDGQIEEIAGTDELLSNCANAQFGHGFQTYEQSIYLVGNPGDVYVIDLQIDGHPIAPLQ